MIHYQDARVPPKKTITRHHHQPLTDFQKGQIFEARHLNKSYTEIGDELHIPRATVQHFLECFQQRGSEENLHHIGRPRKTSTRFDHALIRTALAYPDITYKALCDITNREVSISTIHRRLQEDHVRKWKAVKRALLTKKHAIKRLKWATEHRHWTREDWARVLFSDESVIQKDSNGRIVWVFRHRNEREKYDPKNVRGKSKSGDIFQMIWGCFAGSKLGPIVFINETVNSDVYISVLQGNLLPFIDAIIADGAINLVFQQDNATPHVSKKTRAWFDTAMQEHEFSLMVWPPNSPDMNLIEHVWAHLKRELNKRHPDTMYLHGMPDAIRQVLRTRLIEV